MDRINTRVLEPLINSPFMRTFGTGSRELLQAYEAAGDKMGRKLLDLATQENLISNQEIIDAGFRIVDRPPGAQAAGGDDYRRILDANGRDISLDSAMGLVQDAARRRDLFDQGRWDTFASRMEDTRIGETLSQVGRDNLYRMIGQDARQIGAQNFGDWLNRRFPDAGERFLVTEQLLAGGHPGHPYAKLKEGMSPNDFMANSPEFMGQVPLTLVGVRNQRLESLGSRNTTNLGEAIADSFPEQYNAFREALTSRGLNPDDYSPIPVARWQLENDAPARFAEEVASGDLVLLRPEEASIPGAPTSSTRTYVPLTPEGAVAEGAPSIKLPLQSRITSITRELGKATTANETNISGVLREAAERGRLGDPSRLTFIDDYAGFTFDGGTSPQGMAQSANMATILRTNVASVVGPQNTAVTAAHLESLSPVTGRPVLADLMTTAGVRTPEQAIDYFRNYADLIIQGQYQLMKNGVALVSHGQNTIVEFSPGGDPLRVILRDFGGARIDTAQLRASTGSELTFYGQTPGAPPRAFDRGDFLNTFYHATVSSVLLRGARTVSDTFGIPVEQLNAVIRDRLLANRNILEETTPAATVQNDMNYLLGESRPNKGLLWALVTGEMNHYIPSQNPLSANALRSVDDTRSLAVRDEIGGFTGAQIPAAQRNRSGAVLNDWVQQNVQPVTPEAVRTYLDRISTMPEAMQFLRNPEGSNLNAEQIAELGRRAASP